MSWHVEDDIRAAYARGALQGSSAMSVEAHLLSCAACRSALVVEPGHLAGIWDGIEAEIASTPPRVVERALRRTRVPDHIARLLSATPSLSLSWILAVAIALGFAVGAAHAGTAGTTLYLVVAPLVPLAGVGAAYGPGVDPVYEIGLASPMRSLRLMLVRTGAVLAVSVPLVALASGFLPAGVGAVLWLTPSIALVATGLALSSVSSPARAASVVAVGWIAFVVAGALVTTDAARAARADAQAALAATAVIAGATFWLRRDRFENGSTR